MIAKLTPGILITPVFESFASYKTITYKQLLTSFGEQKQISIAVNNWNSFINRGWVMSVLSSVPYGYPKDKVERDEPVHSWSTDFSSYELIKVCCYVYVFKDELPISDRFCYVSLKEEDFKIVSAFPSIECVE